MVEFSNAKNCTTFYAAFKEWHCKIWSYGECGGCCVPLGKLSPIEPSVDHKLTNSEIQLLQLEQTVNYSKLRLFTCFKLDRYLLNNFYIQECSQNCWWAWVLKKRSCLKINIIFVSVWHPLYWTKTNHFLVIYSKLNENYHTWTWVDLSIGYLRKVRVSENWWLCANIEYIRPRILLTTTRMLLIIQTWLLEDSYCSVRPISWYNNFGFLILTQGVATVRKS